MTVAEAERFARRYHCHAMLDFTTGQGQGELVTSSGKDGIEAFEIADAETAK